MTTILLRNGDLYNQSRLGNSSPMVDNSHILPCLNDNDQTDFYFSLLFKPNMNYNLISIYKSLFDPTAPQNHFFKDPSIH